MSPELLLRTALYSEDLFQLVSRYLDFLTGDAIDEEAFTDEELSDSDGEANTGDDGYIHSVVSYHEEQTDTPQNSNRRSLGGLPTEIALRVFGGLTFSDKIRVTRTSRHSSTLVGVAVQDQATELLARFHLRFTDVRLLLSATGSIISGSAALALFSAGPYFEPGDLDFFAVNGRSTPIVKFLTMAGGYKQISITGPYDFAKGVAKIRTLKRQHTGEKINVIEGYTDNPLDIVVRFHSTPVFVAWAADVLWHGNPELTAAGIAITTLSHLPVDDTDQCREHVRGILAKYTGRGFNYSLNEYPHEHICGVDLRCPATLRSSDDEGFMLFHFHLGDQQYSARLTASCHGTHELEVQSRGHTSNLHVLVLPWVDRHPSPYDFRITFTTSDLHRIRSRWLVQQTASDCRNSDDISPTPSNTIARLGRPDAWITLNGSSDDA
ncbi:hypothetical protein B0H11DRAFT_2260134 [Mycena galericulata]|nr:hypothetical protein B0H11DRAFT_2260134 [Mycena galericulata]